MSQEAAPAAAPKPLLRVLGLLFGLAVVVGGMVGSGIMRAPGVVAQGITSPPLILLAWALGGGFAMLTAMPLVEAGSSIPHAGGAYPIAERAFGPSIGFLTGWLAWLQNVAANGFMSAVFAEYVHRLGFAQGVPNNVLGCGLIVGVAIINWTGTRISGASQSVASGLKGAAFLVLVAILFASSRAPVAAAAPIHLAAISSIGALVMAIRVIYQTYAGWDAAIYFSEEVHRPDRNIARATFWGIGAVAVLYVLINAAVLHVLSPAAIAGSTLAVGDAARNSMGAPGDKVITALGLFSLAAIVNLQIMSASRVTFRMARDGVLPPVLAAVAPGGTPRRSVALMAGASLIFAATGSYESIVRIYAPWSIGAILMICLAAIKLRVAEPDLPRPWRMPLFPWIAVGAALIQVGLIGVMVWDDPLAGAGSAAVAVAPLPIYWLFAKRWRARAKRL
ncbi:MAG TPA: APC family permease [Caulobacteraceae bacterium]|nr:APC family permease [Caulobacteraceae bacterium]